MNYTFPDQQNELYNITSTDLHHFINTSLPIHTQSEASPLSPFTILVFTLSVTVSSLFCVTLFMCRTMKMVTQRRREAIKARSWSQVRRLSDSTMKRRVSQIFFSRKPRYPTVERNDDPSLTSELSDIEFDTSIATLASEAPMVSELVDENIDEDDLRASKRRRSMRRINSLNKYTSNSASSVLESNVQSRKGAPFMRDFLRRASRTWSKKARHQSSDSGGSDMDARSLPRQTSDQSNIVDDFDKPALRLRRQNSSEIESRSELMATASPENDINIKSLCKVDPTKIEHDPGILDQLEKAFSLDSRRKTFTVGPSNGNTVPRMLSARAHTSISFKVDDSVWNWKEGQGRLEIESKVGTNVCDLYE